MNCLRSRAKKTRNYLNLSSLTLLICDPIDMQWIFIFVIFPYVPLWYEDHVFVSRKGISGYHFGLDGSYDGLRTVQVVVD